MHYLLGLQATRTRYDSLDLTSLETYHDWVKSSFSSSLSFWLKFSYIIIYIFSSLGILSRIWFRRRWKKETLVSVYASNWSFLLFLTDFEYPYGLVVGFSYSSWFWHRVANYFICCFNVSMNLPLSYSYLFSRLTHFSEFWLIDTTEK